MGAITVKGAITMSLAVIVAIYLYDKFIGTVSVS